MLEIACSFQEKFSFSHIEQDLPKPSYTIDTLKFLKKVNPDAQLFFIIGGDSLLDFSEWKSYQDIFKLVNVVIANRKGLQKALLSDFLSDLGFTQIGNRWKGICYMRDVLFLQAVPAPYSSSIIREMVIKNEIPRQYLPEKVINYIQDHNLYRSH
jgi:nicotinate-nucleotide adenylyltransferase